MTRRRLGTVLVSVLVSTLSLAAPASSAQRAPLLVIDDPRGDVRILDREGPSTFLRKGIDLTQLKVGTTDGGEPSVRFTFRIRFVTTAPGIVQRLDVLLADAEAGAPEVSGDVIVTLQGPPSSMTYADVTYANQSSGAACLGMRPTIVKARGLVKVDVPTDCLPPGPLSIRVRASAVGPDGGPERAYSRDAIKVPGSHDIGGTAGSERRG